MTYSEYDKMDTGLLLMVLHNLVEFWSFLWLHSYGPISRYLNQENILPQIAIEMAITPSALSYEKSNYIIR